MGSPHIDGSERCVVLSEVGGNELGSDDPVAAQTSVRLHSAASALVSRSPQSLGGIR